MRHLPFYFLLGSVNRTGHIADELGQIEVAHLLAQAVGFACVEPVVVDVAQKHSSFALEDGAVTPFKMGGQIGAGEWFKVSIYGVGDGVPDDPRFVPFGDAGGFAKADLFVEVRVDDGRWPLGEQKPEALLLVGHVGDYPTKGVAGQEAAGAILGRNTSENALEFGAGKAELGDERVHGIGDFGLGIADFGLGIADWLTAYS